MNAGRISYGGATNAPYLTNGQTYPIVSVAASAPGAGALVVIVADNGSLYTVDSSSANWSIVDLYAPEKVI